MNKRTLLFLAVTTPGLAAQDAADVTWTSCVWNIYYTEAPKKSPVARVLELAKKLVPGVAVVADLKDAVPGAPLLWAHVAPRDKNPPPSEARLLLFGRGMTPAQIKLVAKSPQSLVLAFRLPRKRVVAMQRAASKLAHTLAMEDAGFVWDDETREMFTPKAWAARRVEKWQDNLPDLQRHFTVHMYPKGELLRIVSLGLGKFGLPDLVVEHVPRSYARSLNGLVNLVAQTLIETPGLDLDKPIPLDIDALKHRKVKARLVATLHDGATRKAMIVLREVKTEDGDAHNELRRLVFTGDGKSEQQRQSAFLDSLFGSKDEVVGVSHDDEIKRASARARAHAIQVLKPRVQKGLKPKERLLVKGPFRTSKGGQEWMWVEVVAWKATTVSGLLMNEPRDCPNLRSGAKVQVAEADIFDYLHRKADGTVDGNSTGELLRRGR